MRPLHANVRFPDVEEKQPTGYNLRRKRKKYDAPFVSLDRDADMALHRRGSRRGWSRVFHFRTPHKREFPAHLKDTYTVNARAGNPVLFVVVHADHRAEQMLSMGWEFSWHQDVADLFAYDYAAMRTAMQPFRHELLRYVMHPSRISFLEK
jgi:hypothetical protein